MVGIDDGARCMKRRNGDGAGFLKVKDDMCAASMFVGQLLVLFCPNLVLGHVSSHSHV